MNYSKLYEEAEAQGQVEVLTPKYFEWKTAGLMVIGEYKASAPVTSKLSEGTYSQYLFQTDDGLIKFALGKATDNEAGSLLEVGQIYAITYEGAEKISGGRRVNKFKIVHVLMNVPQQVGGKEDVPF